MLKISADAILNEIRLPDYKGRHVFTARLRLVIFVVFWILSAIYFKWIWTHSPFIPILISTAFLLTGVCYNNILKGRALIPSFIFELCADTLCLTLMVYLTGGQKSQFYTLYIIYCIAAGTFYSSVVATIAAILSVFFYFLLVLSLYFGWLHPFNHGLENVFLTQNEHLLYFLNLSLLVIFLPIVIYASQIANHFSRVKERALEEKNKQLTALNHISRTIQGVLSIEKAMREVLNGVIEGLGYSICFLAIPSKKDEAINFYAFNDQPNIKQIEEILGFSINSLKLPRGEENQVFRSILRNKIVFRQKLSDLVKGVQPYISEELANFIQTKLGFKKFIITPLLAERKVVGALVGGSNEDYVHESRVSVLENFINQAALAIETAQLFEELQRKNIDLTQANQIKGDFLAIMSHELRTPLTAVIGFSELLLEEVIGHLNQEQKNYLQEVIHNSEHLLELINSILEFSKIESGKMQLMLERFPLKNLIIEIKNSIIPLLKKKNIRFELDMLDDLPHVKGDERKIKQVILNLLANAIKFTPENGLVKLEAKYFPDDQSLWVYPHQPEPDAFKKGYFKIAVEDTGIGILEKDLNTIFEPFSQVDSSVTRKYEGTGLGLALCQQFVKMHGGVIWVESEFNKGSCFTLLLPLEAL